MVSIEAVGGSHEARVDTVTVTATTSIASFAASTIVMTSLSRVMLR